MNTGTQRNPIEVLDQQEQQRINHKRIQYQKNRQMLYKAHMGSRFDVLITVMKLKIEGSQQTKKKAVDQKIKQYFSSTSRPLNIEIDHFRNRRQANYTDPNTKPISNQLILYGVDFLNNKQILKKFISFNVNVIWLDQSHQAREGLQMNLKDKQQSSVKLQNQEMEIPRGWFQLRPYFFFTFQRKLYCRFATTHQDDTQKQKSGDYYMYQQAKKKFQEEIGRQYKNAYYELMAQYNLINEGRTRQRIIRNRNSRDRGDNYHQGRGRDRNRDEDYQGFQRRNYNNRGNNHFNSRNNYNDNNNFRNNNYKNRYNDRARDRSEQRNMNNNNNDNLSISSQRSRDKNKQNNKYLGMDNNDNVSIVVSRKQYKRRKFSQSIASHLSPQRNNEIQNEQDIESLSFILNPDEIQNSNKFITHFNNLSILQDQPKQKQNMRQIQRKQNQLNLSLVQQNNNSYQYKYKNRQQNLNTSFNQNNFYQQKYNKKNNEKNMNLSFNQQESIVVENKKQVNVSFVGEEKPVEFKKNKKLNTSIAMITILD